MFLRSTVRAGMFPSKLPLGSGWEGQEPSHPAAHPAAPGCGLADLQLSLILDYTSAALGRLAALVAGDDWPE